MKLLVILFLNYYAGCQGLSDSLLKSALHDTICAGERYHYGTHGYGYQDNVYYTGTWNYFPATDRRDDGTIWDMYSNSVRYFPYVAGESACSMQIEHCMPKSWWGGEEAYKRAYQDLFNLNPADARTNGQKSNYPPGHVQKGDKFDNGSFRMDSKTKSQYGWICFEPAEEYRGDFARTYFYMATAYEDAIWASTTPFNALDAMSNDSYLEFQPWLIDVLLDWHRADTVSAKEIHRASVISHVQKNRNPFIDYPELVEYIWGNKKGQAVDFNQLTCTIDTTYQPGIFPRPTSDRYDTIVDLSAVTAKLIQDIPGGYASEKIQSNGTQSITMGSGTTDGYISFSGLTSRDSTFLVFRASPYNTASNMQLDIYANTDMIRTISVSVSQETRDEVTYTTYIPAATDSITIVSVGGATSQRACIQELYILTTKPSTQTDTADESVFQKRNIYKQLINGQLYIVVNGKRYTLQGYEVH